ncbi:hypothetical protein [Flavobacterium urocaniciphilum]|uniref:Uncharacterized protein n=1 Tax=Flavobacterium urocaniciphilum TaxID=1299341 RepID=A0A1H8ZCL0_9FLAO|nr:hypothetical protein [Flavobacterium urocaniciphilum]SEP61897.1 hypothetical protein SAMN05444005_101616 [Flavobacterium urocaniciphilum]
MEIKENLKLGQGYISGYISIFLGISAFLGVICFKYPEWLTTPEFREVYTGESMKILLTSGLVAAMFFAVISLIFAKIKNGQLLDWFLSY